MNKISLILSAVVMIAMIIVIAPNIIALNRGKALRNMALWLGIFAVLGLIYQNFGPGSAHPLFGLPQAMTRAQPGTLPSAAPQAAPAKPDKSNPEGEQGFTPPAE